MARQTSDFPNYTQAAVLASLDAAGRLPLRLRVALEAPLESHCARCGRPRADHTRELYCPPITTAEHLQAFTTGQSSRQPGGIFEPRAGEDE
jgi:hypothetical protein